MRAVSRPRDRNVAGAAIAGLTGLGFLLPVVYLVTRSIGLGGDLIATVGSHDTVAPLLRSVGLAVVAAALSAVIGTVSAVLVGRTDLPGRRVLRVVLALPLAIPSFVGAAALLVTFGPGGLITFVPRLAGFGGALLVLTLLSYPYVYLLVFARLRTTPPVLEESARQLGSHPGKVLLRVVLPQLRGAIGAGTMLVFLYVLSDFGAVSLMRYDTITRVIFSSRLADRPTSLTLGVLLVLLALGVASIERVIRRDTAPAAMADRRPPTYALKRFRYPAVVFVGAVVAGSLLAPIAAFVAWVGSGNAFLPELSSVVRPTLNSTVAAIVAGLAAATLLLPLAYFATRFRSRLGDAASAVVTALFAVPGLAIALAMVFWAIQAPEPLAWLYQSFPLLIAAYVVHFGAQSLRATQAAVAAVPGNLDEVGSTLGVGRLRRFLRIELPLIAPGLISGGGLVMLSVLKELPATLLLAPIGFGTLATRIWGAAADGFYGEVGVLALTTLLLSGLLTWLLVVRPTLGSGPGGGDFRP